MDNAGSQPFAKDSPALQRMQQLIDRWETAHDKRAIFLTCYSMMTANMLTALEQGEFEDPQWVRGLLERFAVYYFVALDHYEAGDGRTPLPWAAAFDATQDVQTPHHVIQHLILGVNAHINHDLVFALGDMLKPEWLAMTEEKRAARYRDQCHVNEVIVATIDSVQDQVVERYSTAMGWVDTLMGPLDERLVIRLITRWRDEVWQDCLKIIELSDDAEDERERLSRQVETQSGERARAILGESGLRGLLDLI